jgi:hypothetical protein
MANLIAAAAETPSDKLGQLYDQVRHRHGPSLHTSHIWQVRHRQCGAVSCQRRASPTPPNPPTCHVWQYFESCIIRTIKEHESRCDSGFAADDAYEVGLAFLAAMEEVRRLS